MAIGLTPRGLTRPKDPDPATAPNLLCATIRANTMALLESDAEHRLLAQPRPGLGATCSHASLLAKSEHPEVKYRLPVWRSSPPCRRFSVSNLLPPYVVL